MTIKTIECFKKFEESKKKHNIYSKNEKKVRNQKRKLLQIKISNISIHENIIPLFNIKMT